MEEDDAIKRLKRGDISGLETLVRLYQYQAVCAAVLVVRDRAAAEDIVQAAFLRIANRIGQFDSRRSFGPWFLRIVLNDAIKEGQRRQRFTSLDRSDDGESMVPEFVANDAIGPEALLEQGETREAVVQALNQLTVLQRAAIVQRYYLDMSEADMARDNATSPGAIKLRLYAARERLQRLLQPLRNESIHTK